MTDLTYVNRMRRVGPFKQVNRVGSWEWASGRVGEGATGRLGDWAGLMGSKRRRLREG